jgi:hypothetical protein
LFKYLTWRHDKSCAYLYDTEERIGNMSSGIPYLPWDSIAVARGYPRHRERRRCAGRFVACRQADGGQDGWLNSA